MYSDTNIRFIRFFSLLVIGILEKLLGNGTFPLCVGSTTNTKKKRHFLEISTVYIFARPRPFSFS